MRKMLKDQTYAQKSRVADAAERRKSTQRKRVARREVRQYKRYRQTREYKDIQTFLRFDWKKLTELLDRLGREIKEGMQKSMHSLFYATSKSAMQPMPAPPLARAFRELRGASPKFVAFDEASLAGAKTAMALENWAALQVKKPGGFRLGSIE